jgi:hypothetical protein
MVFGVWCLGAYDVAVCPHVSIYLSLYISVALALCMYVSTHTLTQTDIHT